MTHPLRYEVNCSILFTELPLLERPSAAAAAGFSAVEFWWPFDDSVPGDRAVEDFVSAVREAGVALVGLNFPAGDMAAGDRGLVSWPARSFEFRESVEVVVGIGEQLGCSAFNALYGNRVPDLFPVEQDELALTNLAFAANAASRIGGTVLLEPISGAPDYPLRTAAEAIAVIDQVEADAGVTNIALLADLYHLAVNGDDVDRVIADHADRIGHVQIADHPGRHEPGTGELPLERQLAALGRGVRRLGRPRVHALHLDRGQLRLGAARATYCRRRCPSLTTEQARRPRDGRVVTVLGRRLIPVGDGQVVADLWLVVYRLQL